jgi:hypothetical protein
MSSKELIKQNIWNEVPVGIKILHLTSQELLLELDRDKYSSLDMSDYPLEQVRDAGWRMWGFAARFSRCRVRFIK